MGHDFRRVCSHRRRDATRHFRHVGVGGVYWALGNRKSDNNKKNVRSVENFVMIYLRLIMLTNKQSQPQTDNTENENNTTLANLTGIERDRGP